jgi:hypothetical protein
MSDDLLKLAERCEGASGPDDTIDMDIAYWCYKNGAVAGINYDPALYMMRRDWSPTASLDAALTLVPEGWTYSANQGPSGKPHNWTLSTIGEEDTHYTTVTARAATAALAIVAAALRARSAA